MEMVPKEHSVSFYLVKVLKYRLYDYDPSVYSEL